MNITIINRPDGGVTAHRTGCRDIAREARAPFSEAFVLGEFTTTAEVTAEYNADFDEETDGWYAIDFKPCTDILERSAA